MVIGERLLNTGRGRSDINVLLCSDICILSRILKIAEGLVGPFEILMV